MPQTQETGRPLESTTDASLPPWLANWKDTAAAVESTLTAVALIVGAIWTYFLFIKGRLRFPRATVEHHIEHWVAGDRTVVHVNVRVANPGGILLQLGSIEVRLQQLLPLPTQVAQRLARGRDPVPKGQSEVLWPLLAERTIVKDNPSEIEPGESDEFHFDFFVPRDTESIEVYSYLRNAKKRTNIGWNTTTIYRLGGSNERAIGTQASTEADQEKTGRKETIGTKVRETILPKQHPPKPMPVRTERQGADGTVQVSSDVQED